MNFVYGKVNGKRVNLPSSAGIDDIVRASGKGFNPNTRCVIKKNASGGHERLRPGSKYDIKPNDKFSIGPDRVKAYEETYFGNKSDLSKQIIIDQIADISQNMSRNSNVELDDNCNWVCFHSFKLPKAWADANPSRSTCRMMLIFPDQFPNLPTNGFYLPDDLVQPEGDRHFWNRGYSGAFGSSTKEMESLSGAGWKWYCTHIKPGAWQPARIRNIQDWKKGDNLWHILSLCTQVLTNPYED